MNIKNICLFGVFSLLLNSSLILPTPIMLTNSGTDGNPDSYGGPHKNEEPNQKPKFVSDKEDPDDIVPTNFYPDLSVYS